MSHTLSMVVPRPVFDYINSRLHGMAVKDYRFVCHLLMSTFDRLNRNANLYIPIPASHVRGADIYRLDKSRLIHASIGYTRGQCREFKLSEDFFRDIMSVYESIPIEELGRNQVNLLTGRQTNRIEKNQGKDERDVTEPKLIRDAMAAIQPRPFNPDAIQRIIAQRKRELESKEGTTEYTNYLRKYLNDFLCWHAILQQQPKKIDDSWWEYRAAYKAQIGGRIGEIKGGLQSASREMKHAAYSGIQSIKNYDLKSSQVNGLIQQFELANLNTDWLESYRENLQAKEEYSAAIGIDTETWKDCLIALLMGAGTQRGNSIHEFIHTYCIKHGDGAEIAVAKLEAFRYITQPLSKELRRWHSFLLNEYLRIPGSSYRYRNKTYISNPTGKKLCIDDLPRQGRRSKVAAFVLQGQEAAFIHHLTILSSKCGFKVVGNEHDGLITIGAIPDEAAQEASSLSGLRNAVLVEKTFF